MTTTAGAGRRSEWTEGDVDANGTRIRFYRTGRGEKPALVLAHGFTDNGLCWSRVAGALQADFDTVMFDARNHGESGTAVVDAALQVHDVTALISQLDLDRPALMGHSVGARTMAEFAAEHPALVSRLVLEDPPWKLDQYQSGEPADDRMDGIRTYLESLGGMTQLELTELGRTQHPDWPDDEFPEWVVAKQQVRQQAADALSPASWVDIVTRIECPTLLIHGAPERGGIVTPKVVQRVMQLNSQVTSRFIEQAGHNIRRENYERFIEVVQSFLLQPVDAAT